MIRIKRWHVLGGTICIVLIRKRRHRKERRRELKRWRDLNRTAYGQRTGFPLRTVRAIAHAK